MELLGIHRLKLKNLSADLFQFEADILKPITSTMHRKVEFHVRARVHVPQK